MGVQKVVAAMAWIGVGIFLLTAESAAFQAAEFSPAEAALKERVEEFYSLLLKNRVKASEAYVAQESLEDYQTLRNNPFVGFEVKSIEMDAEGTSATVGVAIFFIHPQAPKPLPFQRKLKWQVENGEWRLIVPNPMQRTSLDDVKAGENSESGERLPPALQFGEDQIDLGIFAQDEHKQARFSFTNSTDGPVQITDVVTGCECLRATYEKKTYGPGESGELVIDFDPARYLSLYGQTIIVKVEPGERSQKLLIRGQVMPSGWRPEPE